MDLYCQLVTVSPQSSDINWVIIQVELQYGFITVVFVISCVQTGEETQTGDCIIYHIIGNITTLRLNSTTFLYYTERQNGR